MICRVRQVLPHNGALTISGGEMCSGRVAILIRSLGSVREVPTCNFRLAIRSNSIRSKSKLFKRSNPDFVCSNMWLVCKQRRSRHQRRKFRKIQLSFTRATAANSQVSHDFCKNDTKEEQKNGQSTSGPDIFISIPKKAIKKKQTDHSLRFTNRE